jgi:hypothetical protein
MLKPYFGTLEMAKRAALLDYEQFLVEKILYYTGDPSIRTSLEFYVRYSDGDEHWVSYSKDLFDCEQYELFCKSKPELWFCVYSVEEARKIRAKVNKEPITVVEPGDSIYVDLRAIGAKWYNAIGPGSIGKTLPDEDKEVYVVKCTVAEYVNAAKTKVKVECELLSLNFIWNHERALCWGTYRKCAGDMIEVTAKFLSKYPQVITTTRKFKSPRL